ncbi:MAG: RnfABCDGE type electron transport complex subunit B [Ruminococcaceae bacterium]|nr:RnfABCDGE type electron transport complex subunit B [Oscillospiraceae bacterium]
MGNIIAAIAVLGVLGAVFGLVLAVASKIFEVKKDPREEAVLGCLAGANCGGCGFPGCAGLAAAIVKGEAPVNGCAPAGAEGAAKIAEIMGMAAPTGERQVAFVRCTGGVNAKKRYDYVGITDCIAATKVAAGPLECQFGCLGFGSCVKACQFGAMSIGENGVAVVDPEKCTNCGACMSACPRKLIVSVPANPKKVHVTCANLEKGKAAMSVCSVSCIGCGLCEKECKKDAIHVVNGVAVVDYDKCVGCKLCTKVCPRDAIIPVATVEEKEKYRELKKAQAEKAAAAAKAAAEAAKAEEAPVAPAAE